MEAIWEEAANNIAWFKKWSKTLDFSNPPLSKWFVGGQLNICYNAVDRHAQGTDGDRAAVIFESPQSSTSKILTYRQLLEQVSLFAGVLQQYGVQQGDKVILYMPNILEAVIALLASLRIGSIPTCWTHGLAIAALVSRIDALKPKVLITTNCGPDASEIIYYKQTIDQVLAMSKHKLLKCIVVQRPQFDSAHMENGRDLEWESVIKNAEPRECVALEANETAIIMYTSGTTSEGKGIILATGGVAVGMLHTMHCLWPNCKVLLGPLSMGWIGGLSISVLGPLLAGISTVLYEGDSVTPDPGVLMRLIDIHKVDHIAMNIGSLRKLVQKDPNGEYVKKYNTSTLRELSYGGEAAAAQIMQWIKAHLNVPYRAVYGQTEMGALITKSESTSEDTQTVSLGIGKVLVGYKAAVLDDNGNEVPPGTRGHFVLRTPLPPNCATSIFNDQKSFLDEYYSLNKEYHDTKDMCEMDASGNITFCGRCDTTVKIGEARITLNEIEMAIKKYPNVMDVLVAAVKHKNDGNNAVAFYTTNDENGFDETVARTNIIALVNKYVGPESLFKYAYRVPSLPKVEMTGKLQRSVVQKFVSTAFPELSHEMSFEDADGVMHSIIKNNEMSLFK